MFFTEGPRIEVHLFFRDLDERPNSFTLRRTRNGFWQIQIVIDQNRLGWRPLDGPPGLGDQLLIVVNDSLTRIDHGCGPPERSRPMFDFHFGAFDLAVLLLALAIPYALSLLESKYPRWM